MTAAFQPSRVRRSARTAARHSAPLPRLTPQQERQARALAKSAYLRSPYGHASHDWQDAEVACCTYLQEHCGLSNDDAWELGRCIAGDVVRDIETAEEGREF